jgi:hypothetical protein
MRLNDLGRNVVIWQITANLADIQSVFGQYFVNSYELASKKSPFGLE